MIILYNLVVVLSELGVGIEGVDVGDARRRIIGAGERLGEIAWATRGDSMARHLQPQGRLVVCYPSPSPLLLNVSIVLLTYLISFPCSFTT